MGERRAIGVDIDSPTWPVRSRNAQRGQGLGQRVDVLRRGVRRRRAVVVHRYNLPLLRIPNGMEGRKEIS